MAEHHPSKKQSGSRFLCLPGELRNRIYEFVYTDLITYVRHKRSGSDPHVSTIFRQVKGSGNTLALQKVCKQTRHETASVKLSPNTLICTSGKAFDWFIDNYVSDVAALDELIILHTDLFDEHVVSRPAPEIVDVRALVRLRKFETA